MNIVVDTNIVFSAMLHPNGRIGQMLFLGQKQCSFFAPEYLRVEFRKHKSKLLAAAQMPEQTFDDLRESVSETINFISETQIPFEFWRAAAAIVRDVDMDDIAFVALAEYIDAKLWSGDKRLLKTMADKGLNRGISTEQMLWMLSNFAGTE